MTFLLWLALGVSVVALGRVIPENRRLRRRAEASARQIAGLTARVPGPLSTSSAETPPAGDAGTLPSGLPLGVDAPAFTLPDLLGAQRSLKDWLGRPLVLMFLDPACPFSREMAVELGRRTETLISGQPLPIVVSTGSLAANQQLAWYHGFRCPVLRQQALEVATAYRVGGTPMGCLVTADGRVGSAVTVGAVPLLALLRTPAAASVLPSRPNGYALPGPEPGSEAPAVLLPDLGGRPRSLSDWLGRRVLIVFVDPEVDACQRLVPELARAFSSPDTGVVLVLISRGSAGANEQLALHHGLRAPVLLQEHREVIERFGITAVPAACLVEADGRIGSPLALGTGVLALGAAVRAEAEDGRGSVRADVRPAARVHCRVLAPPPGTAISRVYTRMGVSFVKGDGPWQMFRPPIPQMTEGDMLLLGDVAGKWIESVSGVDVLLLEDGTARVCEVNAAPEMDARNPRYARIKDAVLRDGLVAAGVAPGGRHSFVRLP